MHSPDSQSNLKLVTTPATAVLTYYDQHDVTVPEPAGVTPVYRLMDQFFNADRNDGIISVDTAGNVTALVPGTQMLQVDISGYPSYYLQVNVSPAESNGPGPAVRFVVTITQAA